MFSVYFLNKKNHIKYLALALLLLAVFQASFSGTASAREVIIGLRAHNGIEAALKHWQPTVDYLNDKIEGHSFWLLPYDNLDDLSLAANRGEFDFVITNPSSYVEMEINSGASRMLTLINKRQGKPYTEFGSVIFTRADHADITTIDDLRGKTLMAVSEPAFGGWQVAWGELLKHGIDPYKDLKKLFFAGGIQQNVVFAVRDGVADAGVVRTDMLERMAAAGKIDLKDYRPIGQKESEGFPFMRSTDLYPEWAFVQFPRAPIELSQLVTHNLLEMPADNPAAVAGKYVGWTVPLNYQPVHELLKTLKVGPYKDFGKVSLKSALLTYRYWIIALAAILLALFGAVTFALARNRELARLRANLLDEKNRELDFQRLALDEHAIVSIADVRGNITLVNDKFCDISGYSRDELIGQNHRMLKSDEHAPEFYADLWDTISGGDTWHGEIRNLRKDGGTYWVKATIVPFMNKAGKPFQYVAIRTDITERKETEREINQFKTTLDRTQDCIFMFWPDSLKFYYVNQGAMDQVGFGQDELYSMHPFDIKPLYDEPQFRAAIQPLIDGPTRSMTFETIHQHRDGDLIPVEIFLQYIAPEDEAPRFVAIVRDITERKRIDKAKSEFVSTVSHELRTPLTSIKGSLGLIRSGAAGDLPDKMKSMLDIAYNNSDRLVLLINDILDMEKIEAGKMDFHMKPLSVETLLKDAIDANRGYGDSHNVTFNCTDCGENVLINADKDRLMQVLANLMSNAAKFSPDGAPVEISAEHVDGVARIFVKDSGPGIPEEFRDALFEKFTQADQSDTRQKGGTGLGLSITKSIVEHHGGKIGFESEAGKGSTFYVEIPELVEQNEAPPLAIVADGQHRVLICEDEPDIATLLEQMLANAGFITGTARTAAEAKTMLAEGDYNAMTLDLGLPDQDGISLLQELRQLPKTQGLSVIVVSATAWDSDLGLTGDAVGVLDWIEKPIDTPMLISRLGDALRHASGTRPRILHVEDDEDIVQVVSSLVGDTADVVAAKTVANARALLQGGNFDLVILDLMLPDGNGEDLLGLINAPGRKPIPVVVFSAKDVSRATTDSVRAALVKSRTSNDDLLNVINSTIAAKHVTG